MKKLVMFSCCFLLLSTVVLATAAPVKPHLDVDVVCPTSVVSGAPLDVQVVLMNDECNNTVSVARAVAGIGGNSGGTLGAAGLWGPYNRAFSTIVVPKASCDRWGNMINPGKRQTSINIVSSVPPALANTSAGVAVEFITPDGKGIGGDACVVEVTP